MRSTREFDAFGPWIDEVHHVDDLPRLYRDAGIDPDAYRLVLKVPRDIERRNATPDMDLYDYLVAVGDDTLTLLARRGDRYDTTRVRHHEIVAIEDSVDLLDGRLTLHVASGPPVSLRYNGAAGTPVQELTRLLRQLYLPPRPETAPPVGDPVPVAAGPDLGHDDVALVTAYGKLVAAEPWMRLAGTARRGVVVPSGRLARYLHRIWPATLHAALAVADGREIQVLHRREWFTRGGTAVYSLARTVLPRARIGAVQVRAHERYEGVRVVAVHAGGACLELPFPTGSELDAMIAAAAA